MSGASLIWVMSWQSWNWGCSSWRFWFTKYLFDLIQHLLRRRWIIFLKCFGFLLINYCLLNNIWDNLRIKDSALFPRLWPSWYIFDSFNVLLYIVYSSAIFLRFLSFSWCLIACPWPITIQFIDNLWLIIV